MKTIQPTRVRHASSDEPRRAAAMAKRAAAGSFRRRVDDVKGGHFDPYGDRNPALLPRER
jgi:hypothetical protein